MFSIKLRTIPALILATAAVAAVAIAAEGGQDWTKYEPGDPPFFAVDEETGDPIFPEMDGTPLTTCRKVWVNGTTRDRTWHLPVMCDATECCTTSCRTGPNNERVCSTSCVTTRDGGCHIQPPRPD